MTQSDLFVNLTKGLTKLLKITDIGDKDFVVVDSTAISSLEYDLSTQELIVEFQSGSRYLYRCPESVYQDIANASSVGATYVHELRNSLYGLSYIRL